MAAPAQVPQSWAVKHRHGQRPVINPAPTAPVVTWYGAAGTFAGLGSYTPSGHPVAEVPVTGWGFGAGEAVFYTLAMPDGQIILSTTPLTNNEFQPTSDHAEINVFDPARNLFYSNVVPTSTGATTVVQPGWHTGATDAGGGDLVVVAPGGVPKALFLCDGYYFGWQISVYGLYPGLGYLTLSSGNWSYDTVFSETLDQAEATNPAAWTSAINASKYSNSFGETYWNSRALAQADVFPQSGNVIVTHYFNGNGFNSGAFSVWSQSGTLLGAYQIPNMNQQDGATPAVMCPREIKCDPSSSLGDERFVVIYDCFAEGTNPAPVPSHPIQEFSYNAGSQVITPQSVPCISPATDSVPDSCHFDQWGNLYLAQQSITGGSGLLARSCALYCKTAGQRALVTSAPATGSWATNGSFCTPVAPDYYLGFPAAAAVSIAAPLGYDPHTATLLVPGYQGSVAFSTASAQPVPGVLGANELSAADSTFATWTGDWTGFVTGVQQYTLLGFDDSFSLEISAAFTQNQLAAISPKVPVTPGQAYQVTAELYSPSGNPAVWGDIYWLWFDANGTQIGGQSDSVTRASLSTTWQLVTSAWVAPPGAASGQVTIRILTQSGANMSAGTFFLADVVKIQAQTLFSSVPAVDLGFSVLRATYPEFVTPGRPALSNGTLWVPVALFFNTAQEAAWGQSYVPSAIPQFLAGVRLGAVLQPSTFFLSDTETCHGTEASIIAATVPATSDASGQALDSGEVTTILGSDASALTAETVVHISLASADASGAGSDASSILARITDGDSWQCADGAETITATLADTDPSGPELDAGEQSQHADVVLGVPLLPPAWKAAYAHLTRPVLPQPLPSEIGIGDTDLSGTGADAGETIRLSDTDASQAAVDAGESIAPEFAPPVSTRSGPAWEARFRHTARPSLSVFAVGGTQFIIDIETSHGTDAGAPLGGVDTDAVLGTDSGFTALADTDASGTTLDLEKPFRPADTDGSQLTLDLELTAWPADTDASSSLNTEYWSGPLASTDASTSIDTGTIAVSDADASSGTDASVLDVYSYQPPFRFTGGGYEVVVRHPLRGEVVIARSPVLTKALLELARSVTGDTELVADQEGCRCEELERPLLAVHTHVHPAIAVAVTAGAV